MSARPRDPVPHAYPFRLVERLETEGKRRSTLVLTTANGTLTEGQPWPVTLVAEALAQATLLHVPPRDAHGLRLVALDRVTLCRSLQAGNRIEVEVAEAAVFGGLRRFSCRALVGGALAASGEITVAG